MLRLQLMVVCVCLTPFFAAEGQAADQASKPSDVSERRDEYQPPEGFAGYTWNTPLSKFRRLTPEPVYVRIANSEGKVIHFDPFCYQRINEGGTYHAAAMQACRETQGDGYHTLAEYYVDSQAFRAGENDRKVVMFPVTYQFCAHWTGFSRELKGDPLEQLQLCGVRLFFRSETTAQEQAISDKAYRTGYERTLNWLIAQYGGPEDFDRKGVVYVPTLQDEPRREVESKSRYRNWYWCRPRGEALAPSCSASIVLAFDAETGQGQVIFLTAPVWAYAYARQFGGAEGDPLYRVLNGGMPQPRVQHQCVDTFLCRPQRPAPMPDQMVARFRAPGKAADVKD